MFRTPVKDVLGALLKYGIESLRVAVELKPVDVANGFCLFDLGKIRLNDKILGF